MSASRIVLATIEAAAIDIERPSPSMIGRAGQMRPSGISRPSISAKCGRRLKAATARVIARSAAPRMLKSVDFLDAGEHDETLSALAKMISQKRLTLGRREHLRIVEPFWQIVGIENDRRDPDRPGERAAPDLIDARDPSMAAAESLALEIEMRRGPSPGAAARRTPSSSISTPLLTNHAGSSTLRLSQGRPASQDGELGMPVDTNTGLAKRSYPNEPSLALVKRWKRPTRFWNASHRFSPPSPMRSRLCSAARARGAPLVRPPTTILASTSARAPDSMLAACSRR